MASLGEDQRVAQESEPDANEAPAEAGAVPRPQTGQRCSLHMGRRAWLGPVRGPELLPSPQSDPRPNQTFPAPKVGLPTARNSSGSSQGPRAPSLCREMPPQLYHTTGKRPDPKTKFLGLGHPLGPLPHEGARPRSANTTDPQLEGGLSCLKNPAWVKLPSVPVTRGSAGGAGSQENQPGESGARRCHLGCSLCSKGSADVHHAAPSQGAHPTPTPQQDKRTWDGEGRGLGNQAGAEPRRDRTG